MIDNNTPVDTGSVPDNNGRDQEKNFLKEKAKEFDERFSQNKKRNQMILEPRSEAANEAVKKAQKQQEQKRQMANHLHEGIQVSGGGGIAPMIHIDWVSLSFVTMIMMKRAKERLRQKLDEFKKTEANPAEVIAKSVLSSANSAYESYKPGNKPPHLHDLDGMPKLTTATILSTYMMERSVKGDSVTEKFLQEADRVKNKTARELILLHDADPHNKLRTRDLLGKAYGVAINTGKDLQFFDNELKYIASGKASPGMGVLFSAASAAVKASQVALDAHGEWLSVVQQAKKMKEMEKFEKWEQTRASLKNGLSKDYYSDPVNLGTNESQTPAKGQDRSR